MAGAGTEADGGGEITPLFMRAGRRSAAQVRFTFDGRPLTAHAGETILVAILTNAAHLRRFEFDASHRAGFCLMGACQDCWVCFEDGGRARACTTPIAEGMRIVSEAPAFGSAPR